MAPKSNHWCTIHILVGILVGSSSACDLPRNTAFASPRGCLTRASSSISKRNGHQHIILHATTLPKAPPQEQHSTGRRWKNKRKRQTFLPSPARNVSPQEEGALVDQLGYVPPNVCHVSAKSGDDNAANAQTKRGDDTTTGSVDPAIDTSSAGTGRPIAIQSYPLLVQLSKDSRTENNYTPFPTLYWLTCPHVSRAISELERQGNVQAFQLRLEGDTQLASKWWACHDEYSSERWNLLSRHDREWLLEEAEGGDTERRKRESMTGMIRHSGVAGTDYRGLRVDRGREGTKGDRDGSMHGVFVPSVKCLHSHYAHYRSQLSRSDGGEDCAKIPEFNLVGKWTHELLMEQFPDTVF